jgi:myo-inositol-1(or 4)-monophosphatase
MNELRTAIEAARAAGDIQRRRLGGPLAVERKGPSDITTDVDRGCEAVVAEIVRRRHPDHDVLGEEGTEPGGGSTDLWIVDPLDGTKNFSHGYRRFCVSIALEKAGRVTLGVVYNPVTDELFAAQLGGGATLNDRIIRVSPVAVVSGAMVASALARRDGSVDREQLERLARVYQASEALRSDGCAALDLCDVACGRLDGYFEAGLHAWDTAAGVLLVREAGGLVTTYGGAGHDLRGVETLASNGLIHAELAGLL